MADGYGRWRMVMGVRLPSPSAMTCRASELEPHGKLCLPRRRIDVRQQRRGRPEHRAAGRRIVGGADVRVGYVEIRAVEDVEQLCDQLGAAGADPERLRRTQIEVGDAPSIDR